MKPMILLTALLLSTASQADIGNGKILTCKNSQVSFEVFKTAAYNLFQGYYYNGQKTPLVMTCIPKQQQIGSLTQLMTCTENRSGEGKMIVDVEAGGYTGIKTAVIKQEQMHPLAPAVLGSIPCLK